MKEFQDGFVRQTFTNGNKYSGHYKDYKRHGEGKMEYHNGDVYEGKWKDGQPEDGTMTYRNGDEYNGHWRDNKRDGLGC